MQDLLGREIAVENVSAYVAFGESTMTEAAFVASVARRTGCKLLLDVNNVYVNAINHGFDADAYIATIPPAAVAEYHLAGFEMSGACLIDTHGAPVAADVWALYTRTVARIGPRPTLIEWDTEPSGVRRAGRRGADGAANPRGRRCRRCVTCNWRSPSALVSPAAAVRNRAILVGPASAGRAAAEFDARLAIYRANGRANYRNALAATYPVVKRLTGAPFFDAAVDAFVAAHPPVAGDLNIYGERLAGFLERYSPAADLPYLPDVARLEWAIDEANRAADASRAPDAVLAVLSIVAPERLPQVRLALGASCRLVTSAFPILRIWRANQPDRAGDERIVAGRRRRCAARAARSAGRRDGIARRRRARVACRAGATRDARRRDGRRARRGPVLRSRCDAARAHRRRNDRRRRRSLMSVRLRSRD